MAASYVLLRGLHALKFERRTLLTYEGFYSHVFIMSVNISSVSGFDMTNNLSLDNSSVSCMEHSRNYMFILQLIILLSAAGTVLNFLLPEKVRIVENSFSASAVDL